MGTIANVLTGVAILGITQPNNAIAEWSTTEAEVGTYSVKLYKSGVGSGVSTHLQLDPPVGITMQDFEDEITADSAEYSFRYFNGPSSVESGNYVQFEFLFEDPNSEGWCEVTAVPQQSHDAQVAWATETLGEAEVETGVGGWAEDGSSFFGWGTPGLIAIDDIVATINNEASFAVVDCGDWVMTRVRLELFEAAPERYSYIDEVVVSDTHYYIEPGDASLAGFTLSSPYVDVGYTEDGVTLEYTADTADIEVEEETFPIDRVITKETIAITCNMAESSLTNIGNAMAGSVLSGSILTLGAGVNKTMNLKIAGTNPAGFNREIFVPLATSTGAVGMSYKKGEKTIVPVTFQALKTSDEPAMTIVDNIV
ncbi:MAG TPA: hypothetical protein VMV84_05220 [Dehalococcoidales bacterium]|nr:hypothetical protein [Dehalococcoidales bacterium]